MAVYISTATEETISDSLDALKRLIRRLDADLTFSGCLIVSVLFGHEDSPWKWDDSVPGDASGPLYPINALRWDLSLMYFRERNYSVRFLYVT